MMAEEYGKCISILGFRLNRALESRVFIESARAACRPVLVQFFDAGAVAGEKHLFFATLNALNAFSQSRNIAQTPDVEVLLYATAQRQIGEAIKLAGLSPSTSAIAVVLIGDSLDVLDEAVKRLIPLIPGKQDQSALEATDEVKLSALKEKYEIGDPELEALSGIDSVGEAIRWLIVERAALLHVRR